MEQLMQETQTVCSLRKSLKSCGQHHNLQSDGTAKLLSQALTSAETTSVTVLKPADPCSLCSSRFVALPFSYWLRHENQTYECVCEAHFTGCVLEFSASSPALDN